MANNTTGTGQPIQSPPEGSEYGQRAPEIRYTQEIGYMSDKMQPSVLFPGQIVEAWSTYPSLGMLARRQVTVTGSFAVLAQDGSGMAYVVEPGYRNFPVTTAELLQQIVENGGSGARGADLRQLTQFRTAQLGNIGGTRVLHLSTRPSGLIGPAGVINVDGHRLYEPYSMSVAAFQVIAGAAGNVLVEGMAPIPSFFIEAEDGEFDGMLLGKDSRVLRLAQIPLPFSWEPADRLGFMSDPVREGGDSQRSSDPDQADRWLLKMAAGVQRIIEHAGGVAQSPIYIGYSLPPHDDGTQPDIDNEQVPANSQDVMPVMFRMPYIAVASAARDHSALAALTDSGVATARSVESGFYNKQTPWQQPARRPVRRVNRTLMEAGT